MLFSHPVTAFERQSVTTSAVYLCQQRWYFLLCFIAALDMTLPHFYCLLCSSLHCLVCLSACHVVGTVKCCAVGRISRWTAWQLTRRLVVLCLIQHSVHCYQFSSSSSRPDMLTV